MGFKVAKSMVVIFGLWATLPLPSARAEYRAFELLIKNVDKNSERRVTSTLDHIQYKEYYPLGANEVVEYLRSWRCLGRTSDFKPICPPPD